ncbi:hypothetical protein [Aeromicrobium stalagmiti]|uniref:hypothetical protein n=1 Tax=Aeromicrobium stalagmiti TaxID=2738988 RepID=UPI001567ED9B|nr:hypothetical protein [Aeromicrobium stalagmiti]NRQ48884.1 hypothetical protein [Aeromicrobium stalagmiti]
MRKILVLVAGLALGLGFASAAQASHKFTVTTKLEKGSIELGEKQRVTGSVSPASPGKTVKVYINYASDSDGEYHYLGRSTLSSSSTFSKSFTPQDSGTARVKVVKAASGSRAAGSSSKTFKNYAYQVLENLTRSVKAGVVQYADPLSYREDYANLNGSRFLSGGRATWDLRHQCKSVITLAGVPDTSSSDTFAQGVFSAETSGDSVLKSRTSAVLYWDEVPATIEMNLYKKSGSTYTFARYLEISTQVSGSTNPAFATASTNVLCNLPGGFPADLD